MHLGGIRHSKFCFVIECALRTSIYKITKRALLSSTPRLMLMKFCCTTCLLPLFVSPDAIDRSKEILMIFFTITIISV